MPSVLLLGDDRFLEHDAGEAHPERPERIAALHQSLDERPLQGIQRVGPGVVSREDLLRTHTAAHLDRLAATDGVPRTWFDPDTSAGPASWRTALLAAGAACDAVDAVLAGKADRSFAMVRPPGHHAEPDQPAGFCLLNNVAVAADRAVAQHGVRRVLILDPDVHHGNGTQSAFWRRADVLYVSTHRYPFYPGTGWVDEVGAGPGAGYTVNVPVPAGLRDRDLLHVYRDLVEPIVDVFAPELILVSAGFDAGARDPLGGMAVTEAGFAALFDLFTGWADRHCGGRLAAVLEGGYQLDDLVEGVRAALEVMVGTRTAEAPWDEPSPETRRAVARARAALSPYWPVGRA